MQKPPYAPMELLFCIIHFALVTLLLPPPRTAALTRAPVVPSNNTDLAALLAFKAQVKDPVGILAGNWTPNESFCSWVGVQCTGRRRHEKRVVALELQDVPLQGSIPGQLGNLSFLQSLVLVNTNLVGPIPDELGGLRRLRFLDLSSNGLSGTIARTLGNLTRLQSLDLAANNLSGGIPREFQNLNSVQYLNLAGNELSGPIPRGLFNHTPSLNTLDIRLNSLTGPIPDSVAASLPNLNTLVLQENFLSGPIPPAIFNMSQLQGLGVARNHLSGPIPAGNESFHLPMLRVISISYNQFDGPIPVGLSNCKNLEVLSLSANNFTGAIPSWLAMLPNLTRVYLGTNDLTGTIPAELSNHTGLLQLDLKNNSLHGEIPSELGKLTSLTDLDIANNQITGAIPESIGNLSSLGVLDLFGNRLSGPVPTSFGNLVNLQRMYIEYNQLSGSLDFLGALSNCRRLDTIAIVHNGFVGRIPPNIGNLSTTLTIFFADQNRISGSIPDALGNLTSLIGLSLGQNNVSGRIPTIVAAMKNLQVLDLRYNSLSSTIPVEITRLKGLVELRLDGNKLVGSVPTSISSLTKLQRLTLSRNSISSNIPRSIWGLQNLLELDLSSNVLSGSVPTDVGKLTAATKMDLSSNHLSGYIPTSFGGLDMMVYLNLSNNLFQGSIPYSLGKLLSIKELDLSSNQLSGAIPKSLVNLTYLVTLNLSFNRLEGQIPEGGIFSNITLKSLMGNTALCGLPRLAIALCQNNSSNHSRSTQLLLKVLLPTAVAIFISASCLCLLVRRKIINKKEKMSPSADTDLISYQLISYYDLVRATSNFSDNNLIGVGSFGKVFKGQLDDGSFIAIKVFNMHHQSASKSFDIECRALRMARHRNLVKIISTCSNLDFKALILEYMPHGSLDNWLHSSDGRQLSFLQRVDIMLDVAMAIEYLHCQHFEVVLHCDLKPSNVLLDKDMTAHVSDFGISKLLTGDDNSITLTSMPGTVGYMAPELGTSGKASRASDTYSYGIVLLEVFTRKKPTDPMFIGELSLRQWVSQAFPYELSKVIDYTLLLQLNNGIEDAPPEDSTILNTCLESIIDLGLLCTRVAPDERIPISDVVVKLDKIKSHYNCQLARER